ncbi:MAG: hypothetical protein U0Z26_19635 [Anaerolineales bacterium]
MKRRPFFILVSILAVLSLVLSACGTEDTVDETFTEEAATEAPVTDVAATEAPAATSASWGCGIRFWL